MFLIFFKLVLPVTKLFSISAHDFDAKKFAHYNLMLVVIDPVVSEQMAPQTRLL